MEGPQRASQLGGEAPPPEEEAQAMSVERRGAAQDEAAACSDEDVDVDDEEEEAAGASAGPAAAPASDTVYDVSVEELTRGEEIVVCPGCTKPFPRSQIRVHMRAKSCEKAVLVLAASTRPVGRVRCPHPGCRKVCPNFKALRKHFEGHSEQRYPCPKCAKEYARKDGLKKHVKTCGERKW